MVNILAEYDTTLNGLTSAEAEKRIGTYGKNTLIEKEKESELKKFLLQFTEPLTILLIIAGVISLLINDVIDAGVIFFVVILNAVMGYHQENKAENAMEKLKSMSSKTSIIVRDGKKEEIDVANITVGDIVVLEEGDNVPADLKLIETYNCKVDESSLTGESLPVTKDTGEENRAYMNTTVSKGRALGVVSSIGMQTKMGEIASMIQEESDKTPLEIKIETLSKTLSLFSVIICILIFVLEMMQGIPIANTFMTAVSLAVAAIPEGLPAILTLTLAMGMQKMAGNKAIIRKLLAVETLGSCSVICSDKTGTLTMNQLTVTDDYTYNKGMTCIIGQLCNNAKISKDNRLGDPTDISILDYSLKNYSEVVNERLYEIPLDSSRKRMTTVNRIDSEEYVLVKGAPEILLEKCKYIDDDGSIRLMCQEDVEKIKGIVSEFTSNALRVILFAYRKVDDYTSHSINDLENNLIITGIVGMMDPPREGVKDAIHTCKNAGITVKMITGDHKNTASAIAKLVDIDNYENVLTGPEIEELSSEELREAVKVTNVYARVFPEQKVKIVKALKSNDEIVSMTGDGVNDAPALNIANIGVSMGSGTDVAKESSDMILEDDNFSTIIYAIKEGRTIYSNIKRFIKFQLSTNIAAILTILVSSVLVVPLPFNPVQLLWINIIMDGPPAQSLGVEGSDRDIMNIPPSDENILSRDNLLHISLIGIFMAVGTIGLYLYELSAGTPQLLASSIAFCVFVMYQLFNVFNCRSNSAKSNRTLIVAVFASFILQLCAIYVPLLQSIFHTTSIPLESWLLIILVSLTIFVAEKVIRKFENSII
ncbi:MAG: calcium-translocating P-type ATPase, PMCA-type [Methanosphaera sp.]|nr:calcium-translocating P-type ATPase, PMCA-type [Methanosphaera sp.]